MTQHSKVPGCAIHALVFIVALATGCGGSGIAENPDLACVPGAQVACACAGGGQGVQVCRDTGRALGSCMACPMTAGAGTGGEDAGASGGSADSSTPGVPTCSGAGVCAGAVATGGAGGTGGMTPHPATGGAGGTGGTPGTGGRAPSESAGKGGTTGAGGGARPTGGVAGLPGAAGMGGHLPAGSGGHRETNGGASPDAAVMGPGGGGGSMKDVVVVDGGASASGGRAASEHEQLVDVEIIQCLIGPSKSDGTEWDFDAKVPASATTALASALGFAGVGPIINFLATPTIAALSKPDPYGIAELDWNGTGFDPARSIVLADPANNMENTFQPLWLGTRGWASLPLSAPLMIRVTLMDEDLVYDDAIGVATISGAQVRAAFAAGGTYWVRTDEMTVRQILAIGIQVTPARAP
jgi:hypothetical protein